jgi:hypothetical protein
VRKARRQTLDKALTKAPNPTSSRAFGRLTGPVHGERRILADPPLIVPVRDLMPMWSAPSSRSGSAFCYPAIAARCNAIGTICWTGS